MSKDNSTYLSRHMTRRDALKTLGLGAAGVILAACGSNTASTGSGGNKTGNNGGTAPKGTPTPVVAKYGKGSKKIVIWHGLGASDGVTLAKLFKKYSDEKGDVSIQSETYSWDIFYQKFPTAIIAKTPPDMAIMHEWAIPQFGSQQLLQPVGDEIFKSGRVPKNDFNPTIIKKVTYNGHTLCLPFDNHGWGMYYNTKLMKDAGLDPEKLPTNGDEFIDACTKITTDVNGKHPDESGFNAKKVAVWGTHPTWLRPTLLSTMWQFGGGVLDDSMKKAIINSGPSMQAVQYWYDLIYKHRVAPAPAGAKSGGDLFVVDKLGFWWDGSWNLNFLNDHPKVLKHTKAAALNSLSDGKQAAWMSGHMLVAPQGATDNLDIVKDLMVWMSDNGRLWAESGQVPARLSVQNSPKIQSMWEVGAYAKEFQKFGHTEPGSPHITEIQAQYEPMLDAALNNVKSPKAAMDQANKKIQQILDRSS